MRLSLNDRICNEVQKDFRLLLYMRHDFLFGERTLTFVYEFLDLLFVFIFDCAAFMILATETPSYMQSFLSRVRFFFVFVPIVNWWDATKPWKHVIPPQSWTAETVAHCDCSLLKLPYSRLCLSHRIILTPISVLTYRPRRRPALLLDVTPWHIFLVFLFVHLGQYDCLLHNTTL